MESARVYVVQSYLPAHDAVTLCQESAYSCNVAWAILTIDDTTLDKVW